MIEEIRKQLEEHCAIKEFPVSYDGLDNVNTVTQCLKDFKSLPFCEATMIGPKPIIYEMKSDLSLLYTLREYLLGTLNTPADRPLVDIELDGLSWISSKYAEFCNRLPLDLKLDLLKSLNREMYMYTSEPVKHLVKINIPANYKDTQSVAGFKFYLDDITKPEVVKYKIAEIPYVQTKSFLCGGTIDDTLKKYSEMTNNFYKITRELMMQSNVYPTIRNTLFWEENGREVAYVLSDVNIEFNIIRTPLIEGAYPTECKANHKDAFMWLNASIFIGEKYPEYVCRFDERLVDTFLFNALPLNQSIYDISDFYSVGAMRQQEKFYHDVSEKVDIKEAFRLGAMSYFGSHHPFCRPFDIDIISLMRG